MKRVYKTMHNTGADCMAIGAIIAMTGFTIRTISIVNRALLLKRRSGIEFQ